MPRKKQTKEKRLKRKVSNPVEFIGNAEFVTLLLAAGKKGEEKEFKRLQIADEVASELRNDAINAIKCIDEVNAARIVKYDPTYKPEKDEIMCMEFDSDDNVGLILSQLQDVSSLGIFRNEPNFIKQLRFYTVQVSDSNGEKVQLFRVFNPRRELTAGSKLPIHLSKNVYMKMTEKVFLLDHEFDCFYWQGKLYIKSDRNFQRIFEFIEELLRQADQALSVIEKKKLILNFDEMRNACLRNPQYATKLAGIAKHGYLNKVKVSGLKKIAKDYNVDVEFVKDGGKEQIKFNTGLGKAWPLLKLLDDDYLGSERTGNKYAVNSKSTV